MSRVLLALLIVLFCVSAPMVLAEKVQKTKDNVQVHKKKRSEVQKEIKRGQEQITEMRQQERLILDRLDQMELQLQLIRDNLEKRRRERFLLRSEVAEKRKRLKQLDPELEKLRALLAQRLEALYKFGRHAYLNVLTSTRDVSGFHHHWVYLRAVAEQDSALIGQFIKRQQEEEKLIQALTYREEKLGRLVAKIDQEVAELEKVKREQVALLQDIHNQEEMYQHYVTELAAVSRELKNKIEELKRKAGRSKARIQPKGGFASKKGALPYPVQGKLMSRFGPKQHKKFGTRIRSNGIEIATEPLSPVVAVYGGQVLYSEWMKGYGKVIIIDHGDKYYTLTAHLAEVLKETGETVESGEIVGYAGYSPIEQSGGKVYFEIRHLGKAINPEAWLLPSLASAAGAKAR
ncbi:MAG: peptidoglycan DD-metalloendopeptidase family protein [Deltaproteobacteria bacterium]|nr:MAG: peptidoglycan DD-metalloendopeptidase family protein [Deltaproteobacteria bacterium]